jgi:hypothetical protein
MVLLIANRDNIPFYKKGESKTKPEWLKELNLSSKEFDILAAADFTEEKSDIKIARKYNGDQKCVSISVECEDGSPLADKMIDSLTQAITPIVTLLNK